MLDIASHEEKSHLWEADLVACEEVAATHD